MLPRFQQFIQEKRYPSNEPPLEQHGERWLELAEMAVNEQDPEKFLKIIDEINALLAEKENRLDHLRKTQKPETDS